jgi:hypothetical protein
MEIMLKLQLRMSAMQKMQAAAGGKPLGPNGQPSPAQVEAMRVSITYHAPFLGNY